MSYWLDYQTNSTGYNNSEVERKTNKDTEEPKVKRVGKKNILNDYKTYTYRFTIAALNKQGLEDPFSYRNSTLKYVVARSGGKGTGGIAADFNSSLKEKDAAIGNAKSDAVREQATNDKKALVMQQSLINDFNNQSPGKFDFFIENVRIETLAAFNKNQNTTVSTSIEFEIFEPYSMSGLFEALITASTAAGNMQYSSAPYVLKMEFIGYPDKDDIPDPVLIKEAERYFVFIFTSIELTVTESGTRYICKAVPIEERAFGEHSVIKTNIKMEGNTVGDVLKSLAKSFNEQIQKEAKEREDTKFDRYEIVIPKLNEKGEITEDINSDISNAKLIELLKENSVYAFPDSKSAKEPNVKYEPTRNTVSFSNGKPLNECISAVVRDSEYVRGMLKKIPDVINKETGTVPYFIVNCEVKELGINEKTNKPYYLYRYLVLPFNIQYTRIPGIQDRKEVETKKIARVAHRQYDYIYSGRNVDLLKFDLKYNLLYYQSMPNALGKKDGKDSASDGVEPNKQMSPSASTKSAKDTTNEQPVPPKTISSKLSDVNPMDHLNAGQQQTDPYATLAKNLHNALLDNVDQVQCEIEILGDPFYLVTTGSGNYRPKMEDYGLTIDGEAAYKNGDVSVILTFQNPYDIDVKTGEMIFVKDVAEFSGFFRLTKVTSTFKDGEFRQRLELLKMGGRVEESQIPVKPSSYLVNNDTNSSGVSVDPGTPASTRVAALESEAPVASIPSIDTLREFQYNSPLSFNSSQINSLASLGNSPFQQSLAIGNLLSTELSSGLNNSELANAFAAGQDALGNITGFVTSVENKIVNVSNTIQTKLPTTSDVSSAVTSKFGSKTSSPLTNLVNKFKSIN